MFFAPALHPRTCCLLSPHPAPHTRARRIRTISPAPCPHPAPRAPGTYRPIMVLSMGNTDVSIALACLVLLRCDHGLAQRYCANGTLDAFRTVSGSSPTRPSQACDPDSPFVVNKSSCLYFGARLSLSRFYDAFPYDVFYPVAPNVANLELEGGEEYVAASREQMDGGARAVELFLRCGRPFSVQGGGHGNAGASVMLGRRLLDLRYLEYTNAELDEDALYSDVWDGSKDIGTVTVGAGTRSGSAMFSVSRSSLAARLPRSSSREYCILTRSTSSHLFTFSVAIGWLD